MNNQCIFTLLNKMVNKIQHLKDCCTLVVIWRYIKTIVMIPFVSGK